MTPGPSALASSPEPAGTRAGSQPLLELNSVRVTFNQVTALRSVSLHVARGEVVTILGPNGVGKTTTLRTVAGVLRPRGGQILLAGRRIDRISAARIARLGVGLVPEGRRIFPDHTVEENLQLGGYILRRDRSRFREQLDAVYGLFPTLEERRQQPGGTLSGGEAQMLAIARALMLQPRLLMLDEPSLGLGPRVVEELYGHLRRLHAEQGVTLLLVEQAAQLALDFADRAYVMADGEVVAGGTCQQIRDEPVIQRVYFGAQAS